jgi:glycosyltransferase involved in cell wall biosynthesis
VRAADRVIAVSDYTRRELQSLTPVEPDRIRVVHNAVHPRFHEPADPAREANLLADMGVTSPYVLFVSTIEPRKNVATLLRAMQRLAAVDDRTRLVLAGADGWHSDEVYRLARALALSHEPRFLGFVSDEQLVALYRSAAVLAHPALDEGFGLTPLEAMATGTPVIASDAGSLPEVVGDAAITVPPNEVDAWTGAIHRVLTTPSLAAELSSAGERRAKRYSLQRMAEETLAVYREALLTRHGGANHPDGGRP